MHDELGNYQVKPTHLHNFLILLPKTALFLNIIQLLIGIKTGSMSASKNCQFQSVQLTANEKKTYNSKNPVK